MRRAFLSSFCFACFVTSALAGQVVLGSWNIEHLGDRKEGQAPTDLAAMLRIASLDVLALQEIHDTDPGPAMVNDKLDATFAKLKEDGAGSWSYVLHPEREGVTRNQHVGVAWNADRVRLVGEPFRIAVRYDDDETWKRSPYASLFRTVDGKFDFVVISLHMKSNNVVKGLPEPKEIRRLEAVALTEQLDAVRKHFQGERDIVLIGDTNCLSADEPSLAAYETAGFRDLNATDTGTYWSIYKGKESNPPFDRVIVPDDQPEFLNCHQYVLMPVAKPEHKDRLSDHWLIATSIATDSDDDP